MYNCHQYTGWLLYTGQLAEGKRQQKILGSCLVTATYKAVYTGVTVYIVLFTSWEVGTGRNCAWGRPQVVLRSRLRAQFLPIQTSQPLNNIFIVFLLKLKSFRKFTLALCWCRAHLYWRSSRSIAKPKQNITTWFLTCNLYYHNVIKLSLEWRKVSW